MCGSHKFHGKDKDFYLATPVTNTLHVDNKRTDTYVENGSITKPFKTIQAAIDAIVAPSATNKHLIEISPGSNYSDPITINKIYTTFRSCGVQGARISGLVTIDTPSLSQITFVGLRISGGLSCTVSHICINAIDCNITGSDWNINPAVPTDDEYLQVWGGLFYANCNLTNVYAYLMGGGYYSTFVAENKEFNINNADINTPFQVTLNGTVIASAYGNRAGSSNFILNAGATLNIDADTEGGSVLTLDPAAILNRTTKASNIDNDSVVIGTTVKDALETLNTEKLSVISVNTTYTVKASGGDFTTIQAALDYLKSKWINRDATVTISVDPGLFTHTSTILFQHPQGNRINIVGSAPVITTITSLISWSGTAGNYSVVLNVTNAAGMAVGDYCIVRGSTGTGEYQAVMGCWEITNISGTQITVKNTYRKATPTLTITGGYFICLKTILKFNGCDGIYPGNSTGYIYNLALVGDGTSKDGVNVSQRGYNYGNHIVYLGYSGASDYSLGINGFGRYGIAQTSCADLWTWNIAVSNCGSYGVYAYNQSKIAGTGIISSGNISIGVYATDGAWITAVSSFAIGNATVGFYAFNRAGINAELSQAVGNVYSGFQCLGTSYIYAKTSKSINNGYHGYSSSYNGMIYAQSSVATGNGLAINYYGYWSSNGGHIRADSTTASGNFSGDYYAEHFSFIKVTGYVGSPTFSPAVDTMGNGGSIIRSVVATPIKIVDSINNVPAGNISSTTVQAAINELDTEKLAKDAEIAIKVYSQNGEPTLSADNNMAIWIDTDDSNRVYLLFRRGTGDQVAVELA
jgi:hypothetical protein